MVLSLWLRVVSKPRFDVNPTPGRFSGGGYLIAQKVAEERDLLGFGISSRVFPHLFPAYQGSLGLVYIGVFPWFTVALSCREGVSPPPPLGTPPRRPSLSACWTVALRKGRAEFKQFLGFPFFFRFKDVFEEWVRFPPGEPFSEVPWRSAYPFQRRGPVFVCTGSVPCPRSLFFTNRNTHGVPTLLPRGWGHRVPITGPMHVIRWFFGSLSPSLGYWPAPGQPPPGGFRESHSTLLMHDSSYVPP